GSLSFNVISIDWGFAPDAHRSAPVHRPVVLFRRAERGVMADAVRDLAVLDVWDDAGLLALLLSEPPFAGQWHRDAAGRVGAGDRARPGPRDHSRFGSVVETSLGVEVTDPPF